MGEPAARARVKSLRQLSDHARWVIETTWRTSPVLIAGLIGVTVVSGLIPAARALVMRNLINDAVAAASEGIDQFGLLAPWLALATGLTIAGAVTSLTNRFLNRLFADEVDLEVNSRILEHSARLDVALFEDLRFQDTIHLAQRNTARNISQFLSSTLEFGTQLVQVVTLAAVLAALEPWAIVVWIPFALARY